MVLANGFAPAVRGSSPDDMFYRSDEVPVGNVFHLDGYSTFNPNLIQSFELKTGAWQSEFSDANGGVIDVRLREPEFVASWGACDEDLFAQADKELTKLLSFMSTFDGGLYRQRNGKGYLLNAKFIMNMSKDNLDYIEWVKGTLEEVTGTRLRDRPDYNTDGCNRKPQVRLESRCHPFLTTLQERIYINNHKVLDLHMLKLLDAEALAIISPNSLSLFVDIVAI